MMASSVERRIEDTLRRVKGHHDPAGLIRPRSTVPIKACGYPAAQPGRTHDASDRFAVTVTKPLQGGGHPHMTRPSSFSCTISWMAGSGAGHEGIEGPDTMRT